MTGPKWTKHVVLPLGSAAMDLGWLYPWAVLIGLWLPGNGGAPLLSAPSIFLLLLLSWAATRAALARPWSLVWVRVGLIALGLGAVLLALRLDYDGGMAPADPAWLTGLAGTFSHPLTLTGPALAAVFGLGLWWRGITQGRVPLSYEDLEGTFRLGVPALVGCLLLAGATGSGSAGLLQARLGGAVVGFFCASLISLSLARLDSIHATSRVAADRSASLSRDWLAILLSVVAALIILAWVLAHVLAFDLLAAVLNPLLDLLGTVAWLALSAILIPIGLLLEILIFLTRLVLRPTDLPPLPQPSDLSDLEQLQREGGPVGLPVPLTLAVKWILLGLIACLTLFLLARAIFTWRDRDPDEAAVEERESVWTPGLLRAALLAELRRWLGRLFRRGAPAGPAVAPVVPPDPPASSSALTIREIYRQLLRLGAARGAPRHRSTTPYEYLPRLQDTLSAPDELAFITDAYVRARYGPSSPAADEAEAVRRWWEQILLATDGLSRGRG